MEEYRISVAMTVYKNDKVEYLAKALDSIINQTLKANEIVLLADGPLNDGLYTLIDEYVKKYSFINFISNEVNQGLGLALRDCVNHCKYEYIARMDSDDISKPNRFEVEMAYIKEHPEVDVLGSYISEFDQDENLVSSIREVPIEDKDIKAYMKRRCPMNHVSVIIKKDKLLECGNYESFLFNEDYQLWIKMANKGMVFHNIPECLVNARTNDGMFMRRGGKVYYKSEKAIQKLLLKTKYISFITYLINIHIYFFVQRMISNKFRIFLYRKVFRKSSKK